MTLEPLTPARGRVLLAIRTYVATNGHPPTLRELTEALGHTSWGTTRRHLLGLAEDGWIRWEPGAARTIVLLDPKEDQP